MEDCCQKYKEEQEAESPTQVTRDEYLDWIQDHNCELLHNEIETERLREMIE